MKNFIFSVVFSLMSVILSAQGFQISGYVTYPNNIAVSNHQVCVYSGMNTNPVFLTCVYTNNNGWYNITIPNGGIIGPNQVYYVYTYDCNNDTIVQVVQNNQGTTTSAIVNFTICQPATCNAGFVIQVSGMHVSFTPVTMNITNTVYSWSFGDGTSSTQMNPTHIYTSPGTYTVCLYVTIPGVCSDSLCQTIVVGNNTGCNVSFTYSTANTLPNQVQFNGTSNPVSILSQWYWDFGDGTTLNGQQNPLHQYSSPGTYIVCASLAMNGALQCTYCDTIIVGNNINCQASFNYNLSPNGAYTFTGQFFPVTSATQWYWSFGDGTTASGQTVNHVFPGPGTYIVCMTVVSAVCPAVTTCQTIIVQNTIPCNVSFTYNSANLPPGQVQFNAISNSMINPNQLIWNFGDGTSQVGIPNPIHLYSSPGIYQVCVYLGQAGTIQCYYCDSVVVGNNINCQASFSVTQTAGGGYIFNGHILPANTASQWYWDFGDGTSATGQTVSHIFPGPGPYNVCLTVISSACASVTSCQTIVVGQNTGGFGGQIFAGNQYADFGTVYLLSAVNGPVVSNLVPVASVPIDSNGYYMFSNIPYGFYIVQAHLSPNSLFFFNYLPTYYGDVLFWQQATIISVSSAGITLQYDIHLIGTSVITPGNGVINGFVINGGGNKDITSVEHVQVMLLDNNDLPLKYIFTDASGYFEFTGLPWGNYKVQAEIWNKEPVAATIILNEDHPVVNNVIITINDNTVVTSLLEKPNDLNIGELIVFPNPASDYIGFILPARYHGEVCVKILTVSGVKIKEKYFMVNETEAIYSFEMSDIPEGIYILQISGNNTDNLYRKFIKHK